MFGVDGVDGFNVEVGLQLGMNPSEAERAQVRSEVARESFVADHGREPRIRQRCAVVKQTKANDRDRLSLQESSQS